MHHRRSLEEGNAGCLGHSFTSRACVALVTRLARGCLRFSFAIIVCTADVAKKLCSVLD